MTDLCFRVVQGDHIPKEPVQDTFNLEEKRRSITLFIRYTVFVHQASSSTSQSVKGIQAGHFGRVRQRVVGSIEDCDELRVILRHRPSDVVETGSNLHTHFERLHGDLRQLVHF